MTERSFPVMDKEIPPSLPGKEIPELCRTPFNDQFDTVAGLE